MKHRIQRIDNVDPELMDAITKLGKPINDYDENRIYDLLPVYTKDGTVGMVFRRNTGKMTELYYMPFDVKADPRIVYKNEDVYVRMDARKPDEKEQKDFLLRNAKQLLVNDIITTAQYRTIKGTIKAENMDMEAIRNFFNKRDDSLMKDFDEFKDSKHMFAEYKSRFTPELIQQMKARLELSK